MRKRIEQLASGKFDHNGPALSISTDRIELDILEGKNTSGEFRMSSTNGIGLRGVIYSTSPRMECLTPQFDGEEVKVRYQFHSEGLVEGDIVKGEFVIVLCNGEYSLSFVVSISQIYADTSIGKIKNLRDFTKLARESFEEAYQVFYSQNFPNMIKKDEIRERLLYEAIRKEQPGGQRIESFLVAAGMKKPVRITLDQESAEYYEVSEDIKGQFSIKKDLWGYVSCKVSSDADFIEVEKKKITTEDFLGSTCFFDYYIRKKKLHAGRNFGRIALEFPGEQLFFFICASGDRKEKAVSIHHEIGLDRIELMQLYIDYRLKRIVTGVWAKKTTAILDHILACSSQTDFYSLMKAQALLLNRQKQEASWILEDYKRGCTDRTTPEWGYYLYLCTLMERETSYVNRLTAEIENLFYRNQDSSLLFWILLFTKDEYYRDHVKRYHAIKQWVEERGCDSPYLYLEAYYLIWQDPYMLSSLDSFTVKILNWARKQNALSKEIAFQVLNVLPKQREFDPQIFQILSACYEVEPTVEMLSGICSYLIKGQKLSSRYHKWYVLGIEHELRITNLYEAFLVSMDKNEISTVPKMIQMYFRYQNNLSYRQMAVLFVNIIAAKETQEDVYHKYRRTIEQFAMEQINAGHMDDNLAVIYREVLKTGILNHELSGRFSKILFTHKLAVKNPRIERAVILQKELKQRQVVPVIEKTAYFQAYTRNYVILLVDSDGNCYADSDFYYEEPLLNPEDYLEKSMELAPEAVPYLVSYFSEKNRYLQFQEKDEIYFEPLLRADEISGEFKAALMAEIIHYYEKQKQEGRQQAYLLETDFKKLSVENRHYLIEQMIENHLFRQAFQMVLQYGYEGVSLSYCMHLCSYEITACEFEEDDFLIGFSDAVLKEGKYSDVMLVYLSKFYNGPTRHMAEIWKAARKFEIDTFDLEERILTQMLYSTEYVECMEQIYESYCIGGGRELIRKAFLSYFSYSYLVHDMVVSPQVFTQMEEFFVREEEINDTCGIGLLKFYSEQEKLSEGQKKLADRLMGKYICNNMIFSFFKKIDPELTVKYLLQDRFVIEYRAEQKAAVFVSYSCNGEDFTEVEMNEIYPGIFIKEFLMFFEDELQYYIFEKKGNGERNVTVSNLIQNNDVYGEKDHGRYALINDMLFFGSLQEKNPLKKCISEYHDMQILTEEEFKLL